MALLLLLISAISATIVNFCLRKNYEHQKSANGYLCLYFIFSLVVSFALNYKLNFRSFNLAMSSIGMIAGSLNLLMMVLMARALQIGPSGLTFAFQNSASMFPALLFFFLFGSAFGFSLNFSLIIGFICLVSGLYLSVRVPKAISSVKDGMNATMSRTHPSGKWLMLAISIFLIQGVIHSIFHWRSFLIDPPSTSHILVPWRNSTEQGMWFMPGFFLIPTIIQSMVFGISERRWVTFREFNLGMIAGVLNGASTFCLLLATKYSTPGFRPILFPLFAVTVIFLCNLWGKKFYDEPIEWKGMALCLGGVFIGSL